ncbi:MAG: TRAP transporter large permease subunit [Desulfarculus sp.]|nr:TRAP transporter large permease subunit [Desulfarculus sp.]
MEWWWTLTIIMGSLLVILASGLPVAFSFLVINLVGAYVLWGGFGGFHQLVDGIYSSVTMFALVPVPLFVLMGEVLLHTKLAFKAIDVVDIWMGRLPGRLCLVTLGASTLFSCLSGSSLGTTAMLGSMMLPEMERRGYKPAISVGSCMSGGLAMIIPPSALAVILASTARVSVGKVLIGGILPGLFMAFLYSAYIVGRCWFSPNLAPAYQPKTIPFREKIRETMVYLVPLTGVIFVVVGLMFLGVATPTESAALGASAVFILAAIYRRLSWAVVQKSLIGTMKITLMMLMILTGSLAFSQMMAFTGSTSGLVQSVTGMDLPPLVLIMMMQVVILILGCFMEQVSIMMITLPIFMPMVKALGFSDVWFALMMLVNLEIGLKTPPFGLLLFVMRGVAPPSVSMTDIYRSTGPFVLIDVLTIAFMMAFPSLVLFLPEHIVK